MGKKDSTWTSTLYICSLYTHARHMYLHHITLLLFLKLLAHLGPTLIGNFLFQVFLEKWKFYQSHRYQRARTIFGNQRCKRSCMVSPLFFLLYLWNLTSCAINIYRMPWDVLSLVATTRTKSEILCFLHSFSTAVYSRKYW